jgi:hypothetical protein
MRALPQGPESPSYSLRPLFGVSGGARLPCKPQAYAPLPGRGEGLGTGAYESAARLLYNALLLVVGAQPSAGSSSSGSWSQGLPGILNKSARSLLYSPSWSLVFMPYTPLAPRRWNSSKFLRWRRGALCVTNFLPLPGSLTLMRPSVGRTPSSPTILCYREFPRMSLLGDSVNRGDPLPGEFCYSMFENVPFGA